MQINKCSQLKQTELLVDAVALLSIVTVLLVVAQCFCSVSVVPNVVLVVV